MFIGTQKVSFGYDWLLPFYTQEQKAWRGESEVLNAGGTFESPAGLFRNPVIPKYSR